MQVDNATSPLMASCPEPEIRMPGNTLPAEDICKLVFLGTILLTGLVGNAVLTASVTRRTRKAAIFVRLVKIWCTLGAFFVLATIPFHMAIIIAGADIKTEKQCFMFGSLFQVMFGGWLWMQAILLLERYMKVLKASEHLALFSVINMKIITWGVLLMQIMLSFGPVYGWGLYSHTEAKMSMLISGVNLSHFPTRTDHVINNTSGRFLTDSLDGATNTSQPVVPDLTILKPVFEDYSMRLETEYVLPPSLVVNLYTGHVRDIKCLWMEYLTGNLSRSVVHQLLEGIQRTNPELDVSGYPVDANITIDVVLSQEEYLKRISRDLGYLEGSGCELDFTASSGENSFYVLVLMVLQIVVPMALSGFCYARIMYRVWICSPRHRVCLSPKDIRDTMEVLFSSLAVILLYVPYLSCNLAARKGGALRPSEAAHFVVRMLLYLSSVVPFVTHALAHRNSVEYYKTSLRGSVRARFRRCLTNDFPLPSAAGSTLNNQPSPDTEMSTSSSAHARIHKEQSVVTTHSHVT